MKDSLTYYRTLAIAAASCAATIMAPAYAGSATFKKGGVDKMYCDFDGQLNVTSGGNIVITCTGDVLQSDPNAPPPVTPPPVTPPPVTPPPTGVPAECVNLTPVTNYTARASLAGANASALHYGTSTTIYSYPLPKGAQGIYNTGFLQQGDHPATPTEMTIEWSISKCAGDMTYYKTTEASVTSGRGGVAFPCGGINGAVGGSYYWSLTGSGYECRVDNTNTWYINVRYINGCNTGSPGCPVSYYHSEH